MYFITFLRNGILKDLRENVYKKIISLPIPFFSEKKKYKTKIKHKTTKKQNKEKNIIEFGLTVQLLGRFV